MATSIVSRLAPVTARDGVNTRKQVNWASAAARPQETICRSDAIIGLGNPAVNNWGDMMTGMYDNRSTAAAKPVAYSNMRLYMDMADEPWKYSDEDMFDWLELDEALRSGPDRAEVVSYWHARDVRNTAELERQNKRDVAELRVLRVAFLLIAKQVAGIAMRRWIQSDINRIVKRFKGSATKIQALVRGYETRCNNPRLDCCMCLSHRISPHETSMGYMCRDCGLMGPYEEIVEEDPWNWNRADYMEMGIKV